MDQKEVSCVCIHVLQQDGDLKSNHRGSAWPHVQLVVYEFNLHWQKPGTCACVRPGSPQDGHQWCRKNVVMDNAKPQEPGYGVDLGPARGIGPVVKHCKVGYHKFRLRHIGQERSQVSRVAVVDLQRQPVFGTHAKFLSAHI
jgi:hypothetical protein